VVCLCVGLCVLSFSGGGGGGGRGGVNQGERGLNGFNSYPLKLERVTEITIKKIIDF
jgi:hypothetical protein